MTPVTSVKSSSMVGLGPPPEGDVDKGPALIIASCVTIFIIVLVVILRFMVRIWVSKAIGWDDWTILFAVVRLLFNF